jgi:hypothetical protein
MAFRFLDRKLDENDFLILKDEKNKFSVTISEIYFLNQEEKELLNAPSNIFINYDVKKSRGCKITESDELNKLVTELIIGKFGSYGSKIFVPENLWRLH